MMERRVAEVLASVGDAAGELLWRRVCGQLGGHKLRVGVAALAHRHLRRLPDLGVRWVPLGMDLPESGDPLPSLAAQHDLLAVHALLWVTPLSGALGQRERSALAALAQAGAPARRALMLEGYDLLQRMSDQPEHEREQVRERVASLLDPSWGLIDESSVEAWLSALRGTQAQIADQRRVEVARVVLSDALARACDARERVEAEAAAVSRLLAQEDTVIAEARARAERTAAHLLSAVRRNTERLLVELHPFLVELEARIPGEVAAVDDPRLARRVLPHWLDHVVRAWLHDRLGQWRVDLLAELDEILVEVDDETLTELLPPAVHPPVMGADGHWARRLGVSAALGAGAALAVMGLWLPGLLALSGGMAWSSWGEQGREQADRSRLAGEGVDALRAMGRQISAALQEQLTMLEQRLDALAPEAEGAARQARAEARTELRLRLGEHQARQRRYAERCARLQATLDTLSEAP